MTPRDKLPAPAKIKVGRTYSVFFPRSLFWKKVKGAKKYLVEVFDWQTKELVFSNTTWSNFLDIHLPQSKYRQRWSKMYKKPLYYFARVAAIDKDGVVGRYSRCVRAVSGYGAKKRRGPSSVSLPICAKRMPAVFGNRAVFNIIGRNVDYDKSMLQVSGASFLMLSTDVQSQDEDFAAAMLASVQGMYWLNHRHGIEASFKSKMTNYNTLAEEVSPTQIEARYHMRWKVPFFWKRLFSEFQVSAFAGYEYYKNDSASNLSFAKEYQLYKLGLATRMPVFDNWDTGGELVYGMSGGSQKMEMQGYINYFVTKEWAVGMGYRIHLIRIEDQNLLPSSIELPFRETYGEAFGVLRHSF